MKKIQSSGKQPPMHLKPLVIGIALATAGTSNMLIAQGSMELEEVVVTARKRTESMQDIPISMQALDATRLSDLGITSFEDYALMLPNVSFKSFGTPGSATIFMRGVADGGDGNASGSQPSVGLYLDEQPVTAIAANLDIHIYDIARIEALAGPQATLYGASSQSGTLKIVTNKPDQEAFSAGFDVGGFATDGGDESYSAEGYVNVPMGDSAALRLVGWTVTEGGWIDNQGDGLRTYYLPPWSDTRVATKSSADFAEDDFNELDKVGLRAALGVDLGENWTATGSVIYQKLETDGVWEFDYNLDDDEIHRFNDESSEDEFAQFGLTIEGEIANHNLIYAGSYLDRDVEYTTDYSAYGDYLTWVPWYACDYTATATETNSDCTSTEEFYKEDNTYERTSHELRLQSMGDGRLQYTLGLFWQENTHEYFQQWIQPGMSPTVAVNGIDGLYFRTDQERTDTQFAAFGELTFDITEALSATFGMRYYDEESEIEGVVGWGPHYLGYDQDTHADSKVDFDDELYKFNVTWRMSDDAMVYATYSEGYRPGGLNRDPALIESAGTQSWSPDKVENYEVGWKTTLMDKRLRFNGAAYFMDWDDIQFTIYDFSLSACCGSTYNLSTAEISGFESDITFLATEALTLTAAVAYNDAETTDDFIIPSGLLAVPDGTALPNIPEWKYNATARYTFRISDFDAFAQLTYSYTDESTSGIRPPKTEDEFRFPGDYRTYDQDSYGIANFRAGISKNNWGVDVWVNNLTDEVADYYVHPRNYEPSTVTNRPISYGAKYWMRF